MQAVTLLFLLRTDAAGERQILLAMKKRGHGMGKWNGTGGKVEPGETIMQAAVRECQEEIGVAPEGLRPAGRFSFYVKDDPVHDHDIHVFTATQWQGDPCETDEMRPAWFTLAAIPYDTMWADDALWLPHVLAGTPFTGTVTVDDSGAVLHAAFAPGAVQ